MFYAFLYALILSQKIRRIETTNKNYLTTEGYIKLAKEISDVREDLELAQHTLEFIKPPEDVAQNGNFPLEYSILAQYANTLFYKLQGLNKKLDYISATLYSTHELRELKEFVDDEYINQEVAEK